MKKNRFFLFLLIFLLAFGSLEAVRLYPISARLNIRAGPSSAAARIGKVNHGTWIELKGKNGDWFEVKTPAGLSGYVLAAYTTDLWIKILKKERLLILLKDKTVLKRFPAAFGFNARGDKVKQGDGCTPEGRFYICEIIQGPKPSETYGPVSLRISYPNPEDARRGLRTGLISRSRYHAIIKACSLRIMPPQNTGLGGSIKIHGGDPGVASNWTLGCIALTNKDLSELFGLIAGKMVMVEIYPNKQAADSYSSPGFTRYRLIKEAESLKKNGCLYTSRATGIIPLSFPEGDFDKSQGVCTDFVIRTLRGLGIDLQALVYEDIYLNPGRYKNISRANHNIDHRRTRNLDKFFKANSQVLTLEKPELSSSQWLPGDIVLMDTGISNGTIFDHIGLVSENSNSKGRPLVYNLWTIGSKLSEMDLLDGIYPKIVGHYRLFHPFFYNARLILK